MTSIWMGGDPPQDAHVEVALDALCASIPGARWGKGEAGDDTFVLGLPAELIEECGDDAPAPGDEGLVWVPGGFAADSQGGTTLALGPDPGLHRTLFTVGLRLVSMLDEAASEPRDDDEELLDDDERAAADFREALGAAYVEAQSVALDEEDASVLLERWQARQRALERLRLELGEADMSWSADLAEGLFRWERADGTPLVMASTRPLVSWGKRSASIRMGWELEHVPEAMRIPAVLGLPGELYEASEGDAWELAMRSADVLGAHYLYGAPGPTGMLLLGLWDVRKCGPDEPRMVVRPPWQFVLRMLDTLLAIAETGEEASELLAAWGESFSSDFLRRGTPFERPLRDVGEQLVELAREPSPDRVASALRKLREHVSALEQS